MSTPDEWEAADAREWIAVPGADDDKYARGVLGMITGSHDYPGAAVLGVEAAMRTGVGMVRYTGPRAVAGAVLARRPEAVTASGRVQAWLIGSGMSSARRTFLLSGELGQAVGQGLPTVLDAGALDLVGQTQGATVITPHARELSGLLKHRHPDATAQAIAADPGGWAQAAADELDVTVLLKGSTTHIAHAGRPLITVSDTTPWLATAGTGDVLAGILGALLATHADEISINPVHAMPALAATAAFVHALAAELASGGGPIAALDVAEAVPPVIAALLDEA